MYDDFYLEPEQELDFNRDHVDPLDSYRFRETLTLPEAYPEEEYPRQLMRK